MKFGNLTFEPVEENWNLVAQPVADAIKAGALKDILVSEIDPGLSDTAAFCEKYDVSMETGANCVIVEAKKGEDRQYAACVVLGSTRADVNGIVRRQLEARKVSFAPMEQAVAKSGMEYGAITPIGLPADWPILVDEAVAKGQHLIVGSGIRKSKLLVSGELLASLPNVTVLALTKS